MNHSLPAPCQLAFPSTFPPLFALPSLVTPAFFLLLCHAFHFFAAFPTVSCIIRLSRLPSSLRLFLPLRDPQGLVSLKSNPLTFFKPAVPFRSHFVTPQCSRTHNPLLPHVNSFLSAQTRNSTFMNLFTIDSTQLKN